jgi:D-alanyl-D-alanine carboxypeptidase/D-alanyl-D-alanine-endopeptidase (penicillin-binding protein 4)
MATAAAATAAAATATATTATIEGALPDSVLQMLDRAGVRAPGVGVYIAEPGAGLARPVVQVAADQAFVPASVMKLVTTIAALELLGPQYRWTTPVLATGRIDKGVIEGSLIVRGANDPALSWAHIDALVKRLRKRGIHTIQGNIVADRRLYMAPDNETLDYVADTAYPWNSPPDSLVVSGKMVTVRFVPDARTRSVVVTVNPPIEAVQIRGSVAYVDGPCVHGQPFVDPAGALDYTRIRVDGSLSAGCGPRSTIISVLGHQDFIQRAFAQLWKASGGVWNGRFESYNNNTHNRAVVIDRIVSPPLSEVVKEINKPSNNLMARQLFLQLALSDPAPKVRGALALRAFDRVKRLFREKGIDVPDLAMDNGAGVSFAERVSPRGLARMLNFSLERPYANTLMASLPVAGVDGTMAGRMRQSPAAGKAFLKTGSVPESRTLAGYVRDASGKLYIAVVLVNHRNAEAALPAMEATIDWLYRRPNERLERLERSERSELPPVATPLSQKGKDEAPSPEKPI